MSNFNQKAHMQKSDFTQLLVNMIVFGVPRGHFT